MSRNGPAAQADELRATLGRLEAALGAIDEALAWTDPAGRVRWSNAAFDRLTRRSRFEVLGKPITDVLVLRHRGAALAPGDHPYARGRSGLGGQDMRYQVDGAGGTREVEVSWFPLHFAHDDASVVLVVRDVTDRVAAEAALRHQIGITRLLQSVAAAANAARTVDDALRHALDAVCEHLGWPIGHAYVVAPDGTLMPSGVWHLVDAARFGDFRTVTETTRFLKGEGLPGEVLAKERPCWRRDVRTSGNFPRAMLARELPVAGGFAVPVWVGDRVAAVLEFYTTVPADPDDEILEVMGHVGMQLGRVIERHRAGAALRDARDVLEQRVAERTTALAAAIDDLRAQVAEREATASALRDSEERYREVVESAGDFVITIDPDGLVTSANRAFTTITGWAHAAAIGRPFDALLRPDDVARARGLLARVLHDETPDVEEFHLRTAQGGEVVGEFSARPLRRTGAIVGALAVCRDVTQRKELEQMKDELVSTVSHELRTPLASLLGFTELLLKRDLDDVRRREFLTIIHDESHRLTNLINDLLDLQRMERGGMTYRFMGTEVEPLLHDAAQVFAGTSARHHIAVDLPGLLPVVRADDERLRQVLANLVSNAIKYSPDGGRVTLRGRADGDRVVLSVSDEGVGIPPDAIDKLFVKFFRVDSSEARRIGGTGLGLALVKEIVTAHGGEVWVESAPGAGSTFSFSLPVHRRAAEGALA